MCLTNNQSFSSFIKNLLNFYKCDVIEQNKSNFVFVNSGFYGRILNQINYGLSPLKLHLFTYNLTDNPMCPNCFDVVESTKHFFFECASYSVPRRIFIDEIEKIVADFNLKSELCRSNNEFLLNLVLQGVNSNIDIFRVVSELVYYTVVKFLSEYKRFCK